MKQLTHPRVADQLASFAKELSHAILLVGPAGSGKGTIARSLAAQLLGVSVDKLDLSPHFKSITPLNDSISIDHIREIGHILSLKLPAGEHRVIIIEDAHHLTTEAQNALLKMLEEPPAHTIFVLTASNETALLPTVRSRVSSIQIARPSDEQLDRYFRDMGFDADAIHRANLMSGGLPGLMHAILANDTSHPLVTAASTAREILRKPAFERLAMVDGLAKDREQARLVLAMLQQMSHVALAGAQNTKHWQIVLREAHSAEAALLANGQAKLVLTNLMLSL